MKIVYEDKIYEIDNNFIVIIDSIAEVPLVDNGEQVQALTNFPSETITITSNR